MTLASVGTSWAGLVVFRAGLEVFKAVESTQAAGDILGSGIPGGAACSRTWLQKWVFFFCFGLSWQSAASEHIHLHQYDNHTEYETQHLQADNTNTSCLLHTLPSQPPSLLLTAAAFPVYGG